MSLLWQVSLPFSVLLLGRGRCFQENRPWTELWTPPSRFWSPRFHRLRKTKEFKGRTHRTTLPGITTSTNQSNKSLFSISSRVHLVCDGCCLSIHIWTGRCSDQPFCAQFEPVEEKRDTGRETLNSVEITKINFTSVYMQVHTSWSC